MSDIQKIIKAIAKEIIENDPVVACELDRLANAMNGISEYEHDDMLKAAYVTEDQSES